MQAEQPVAVAIGACANDYLGGEEMWFPAQISAPCVDVGWSLIKALAAQIRAFCTGEQVMVRPSLMSMPCAVLPRRSSASAHGSLSRSAD
jgi:hypothetical protein